MTRMRTHRLASVVLAGSVLVGALLVAGCRREAAAPQTTAVETPAAGDGHAEESNALHLSEDTVRDLRLSTALVTRRTGVQEVAVLGEVTADQDRYAEIAPPIGGQVVELLAGLNAPVARGAPLARLRSTELGRARADLIAAVAGRDLARQALERKRGLAQERIVPQREVQEAEAALRGAEAAVGAATAGLQALGISDGAAVDDASLFVVRSPVGGRVLARQAIVGSYAEPSRPLFTVADLTRVWVIAQAFERDAVSVRTGSTAHVALAALPGRTFDGTVTLVGNQVDAGSRTLPIRVELPNTGGVLRPGMSATVRLEVGGMATQMLVVPVESLQRVGDRWLAFVPRGPAEFEMRPVGRGRDLGPEVEVVSGLEQGDTVVVDGAFLLKAEAEKKSGGADEHGH